MRNVYLLKEYDGHTFGEVIQVSNNIAFGLIDSGVAREPENRDFIVKPEYGQSKAFKTAPRKGTYIPKKRSYRRTH